MLLEARDHNLEVPGYENKFPDTRLCTLQRGLSRSRMAEVTPWPVTNVAARVKKMIIADSIVVEVSEENVCPGGPSRFGAGADQEIGLAGEENGSSGGDGHKQEHKKTCSSAC